MLGVALFCAVGSVAMFIAALLADRFALIDEIRGDWESAACLSETAALCHAVAKVLLIAAAFVFGLWTASVTGLTHF